MTTGAAIGHGATFGISDDQTVTGTFVNVAGITNINPPSYTRDAIEDTDMDSPDSFREYIAGLMDAGEVSLDLNYVAASADVIIAAMTTGEGAFRITFPNAVTWTFLAIPTAYSPGAPFDDKQTATATFKITGKPTLA